MRKSNYLWNVLWPRQEYEKNPCVFIFHCENLNKREYLVAIYKIKTLGVWPFAKKKTKKQNKIFLRREKKTEFATPFKIE